MGRGVHVIGVGMTAFAKPSPDGPDYPELARQAGEQALADAGVEFSAIEQAVCGYVYGDSTCGQRAVYGLGTTGVPVFNVNNNCATGSSALMLAWNLVRGGVAECVLALGFERMEKGSLKLGESKRTHPLDRHLATMVAQRGMARTPPAAQLFGNAGLEHMERHGSTPEQFAQVAVKNHAHSVHNERAQFRDAFTLEQVLASPPVHGALTRLQCCPTSDGAAAAILASEDFMRAHGIEGHGVTLRAMAMATDLESSFGSSAISLVGFDMARLAASRCYEAAGLGPQNVDVIELHDCFSANELITYEALGLCEPGHGGHLVDEGRVTYGGSWVVNPSGGLISKGHPLGATGLAQCAELSWQLRGECGQRQVEGASVALQHNLGLGGACVVAAYSRD